MSKPREILLPFVDDMVLAIMAGRKTNTRRELNPQPQQFVGRMVVRGRKAFSENEAQNHVWNLPYQSGDRIGVRKSARLILARNRGGIAYGGDIACIEYRCDKTRVAAIELPRRLKPMTVGNCFSNGIFKEGVRTWLEVTGVRIERLYKISEADAIAEGIEQNVVGAWKHYGNPRECFQDPRRSFASLWESIYGEDSFDDKWVIVTEFERVK